MVFDAGKTVAEMWAKAADWIKVETKDFQYVFGVETHTVLLAGNERADISFPLNGDDFGRGVIDYIEYKDNRL